LLVSDFTEAELVARVQSRLAPPPDWLVVGIGDDAAVVEPERGRLEALSVDALVEGVHFDRRFTPPDAIGHRALAVNLSDLAAMGASPRWALASFMLPSELSSSDFDAIVGGLSSLAARYGVHVVGGNVTRSPGPLVIDVSVSGTVKPRRALKRSTASAGDDLYVTGTIGGAAAGLQMLREASANPGHAQPHAGCVQKYLYPDPRVREGTLLGRNRAATACMDLSDGLADGVRQIAQASGVGVRLEADALPIDSAARQWFEARGEDAVDEALSGGDDYELVFASKPAARGRLRAVTLGGAKLTRIGVCTPSLETLLSRTRDGVQTLHPVPRGYAHFR
jgi:thiamine-monophosphate kinase